MLSPGPALRALLVAPLLLKSGACTAEPPPIVWEGEHVDVGTHLDLAEWCPGTLTRLDEFAGALKLQFEVPDTHRIRYYVYPPPLSSHGVCSGDQLACTRGTAVHTTELYHPHELVHAVSDAHGGGMPHFFEEGAATYWGKDPLPEDFRGFDLREELDTHWSDGLSNRGYALAANFIAYVVRTRGIEQYRALLRGTTRSDSRAQFEAIFAEAFGFSLAEVIEDYEKNWPYCEIVEREASFYECSRPAMALTGEKEFDLDISCADPEVVGPSNRFGDGGARIWRDLTVELTEDESAVAFSVPALGEENTVMVEIMPCDTDCRDSQRIPWTLIPDGTGIDTHSNWFSFSTAPGRYIVRVSRAADDPGPVRFRWL